jgi:hypothetical protein
MEDKDSREAFKATMPDPQQANLGSQIAYIDKNPLSPTYNQKVSAFDVQMTESQRRAADLADRNANRADSEMTTVETANGTIQIPKYAMGGGMGGVGAGGGPVTVDRLRPAIVAQESGGNYTLTSPKGALGAYQIMPDTAKTLAGRAGLPWRRDLMTSNTPEAKQYQDTLGTAALQEAISAGKGDLATTAMYYHGGSNRAIWGPKTRQYAADIAGRMGGGNAPAPAANTMPAPGQIIPGTGPYAKQRAQEQAKADVKFIESYPDTKDSAVQSLNLVDQMIGDLNIKDGKITTGKRPPHAGFEGVIGMGVPGMRFVPGTEAASFDALLKQVEGKQFLQAYNSLRGTGSITEIEGQKATAALSRMTRSNTEKDFVAAAREFQAVVRKGIARADARAAKLNGGGAAPAASAAPKRMKYDPATGDLK